MASKAFFLLSTIWIKTWKLLENFYEDILENAPFVRSLIPVFSASQEVTDLIILLNLRREEKESNYQRQ